MAFSSQPFSYRPPSSGIGGIGAPGSQGNVNNFFGGPYAAGWPNSGVQGMGYGNFGAAPTPYPNQTAYQQYWSGGPNPYYNNFAGQGGSSSSGGGGAAAPAPFKNPLGAPPGATRPNLSSDIKSLDYNQLTQQAMNNQIAGGHREYNPAEMTSKLTGERGISGGSGVIASDVLGRTMSGMGDIYEDAQRIGVSDPLEMAKFQSRNALAQAQDAFAGANLDLQRQGIQQSAYGNQQQLLLQLLSLMGAV